MTNKAERSYYHQPNIEFDIGDVQDLKFASDSFDLVTARMVFHHVEDCSRGFAEVFRRDIEAAIQDVLDSGTYILGTQVAAFEREFADYCGTSDAIGVGSGTDALCLALRAFNVGPGDEVITVSHTAVATVAAIEMAGATPVLIDIEPNHYTLDPERLSAALGPRTRAIIPVHLYGQPADMGPICDFAAANKLVVIEDCAQAHGARIGKARVGSIGDAGCFSFYPTKNLGALGDGGMIVTSQGPTAERLRRLREYGWSERSSLEPGVNSRLDEVQAAILRVKLTSLDADNARRQAAAQIYDTELANTDTISPVVRPGTEHVFHLYVVQNLARDKLRHYLAANGISSSIHYPLPVHRQPAYINRIATPDGLQVTAEIIPNILTLPLYPELTAATAHFVAMTLRAMA